MAGGHEFNVDAHEFEGKRALVTGGSKRIGQAVVARMSEGGATVLATARTQSSDFADTSLFVSADITTAEGCAAVLDAVRERLGGIDIIVHVVGGSSAPADKTTTISILAFSLRTSEYLIERMGTGNL